MDVYTQQAQKFMADYGFSMKISQGETVCRFPFDTCNSEPRTKHTVSIIRRDDLAVLQFPFYGSIADHQAGKMPSAYDILACLSSDSTIPDTAREVMDELCITNPLQAAHIARFGRRVRAYFTQEELNALQEIS